MFVIVCILDLFGDNNHTSLISTTGINYNMLLPALKLCYSPLGACQNLMIHDWQIIAVFTLSNEMMPIHRSKQIKAAYLSTD